MKKYFIYSAIDIIEFISGIGYIPGKKKKEANTYMIIFLIKRYKKTIYLLKFHLYSW